MAQQRQQFDHQSIHNARRWKLCGVCHRRLCGVEHQDQQRNRKRPLHDDASKQSECRVAREQRRLGLADRHCLFFNECPMSDTSTDTATNTTAAHTKSNTEANAKTATNSGAVFRLFFAFSIVFYLPIENNNEKKGTDSLSHSSTNTATNAGAGSPRHSVHYVRFGLCSLCAKGRAQRFSRLQLLCVEQPMH